MQTAKQIKSSSLSVVNSIKSVPSDLDSNIKIIKALRKAQQEQHKEFNDHLLEAQYNHLFNDHKDWCGTYSYMRTLIAIQRLYTNPEVQKIAEDIPHAQPKYALLAIDDLISFFIMMECPDFATETTVFKKLLNAEFSHDPKEIVELANAFNVNIEEVLSQDAA